MIWGVIIFVVPSVATILIILSGMAVVRSGKCPCAYCRHMRRMKRVPRWQAPTDGRWQFPTDGPWKP